MEDNQKADIIIWGTGIAGQYSYLNLDESFNILAFTDNDERKWGTELSGIKVISPDEVRNYPNIAICIASIHYEEILAQIINRNITSGDIIKFSIIKESIRDTFIRNNLSTDNTLERRIEMVDNKYNDFSFDDLLPDLSEKWQEIPGGSDTSERFFAGEFLLLTDDDFLKRWDEEYNLGPDIRGWYWRLYGDLFKNKKVLEVGSGMGFDAVYFASLGAKWYCCDISNQNLQVIKRIAAFKNLDIHTVYIDSIKVLEKLGNDFDFIWCNGSLLHIPFKQACEECAEILPRLKTGGRWIELAYPRERWVREGSKSFSQWGKMTDGERTPWVEWYDVEKLKLRLYPARFDTVLEHRFSSYSFVWIDIQYLGLSSDELWQPIIIDHPENFITTPPSLWNHARSILLGDINHGENITVEIICLVETGAVGFALENNGRFISREIIVGSLAGAQLIYLSTFKYSPGTSITMRNGSGLGSCRFKIESIKIRPSV